MDKTKFFNHHYNVLMLLKKYEQKYERFNDQLGERLDVR